MSRLTTHNGPLGPNGSMFPNMGPIIAKQCELIRADRDRAFMREARAFASTPRPGSMDHLRKLIGEYRTGKRVGSWHRHRVLIVAEVLKLKKVRVEVSAPLSMAAE